MGVFSKTVFDLSPSPSALCRELVHSHRFSAAFCGNGFQDCQLQLWSEGSPGPQVLHFLLLWTICTWMLSTVWNSLQSTSQSFHPLSCMFPEHRKQSTSPGLQRREEDFGPQSWNYHYWLGPWLPIKSHSPLWWPIFFFCWLLLFFAKALIQVLNF